MTCTLSSLQAPQVRFASSASRKDLHGAHRKRGGGARHAVTYPAAAATSSTRSLPLSASACKNGRHLPQHVLPVTRHTSVGKREETLLLGDEALARHLPQNIEYPRIEQSPGPDLACSIICSRANSVCMCVSSNGLISADYGCET